jgi:hypothetical protein
MMNSPELMALLPKDPTPVDPTTLDISGRNQAARRRKQFQQLGILSTLLTGRGTGDQAMLGRADGQRKTMLGM